MKNQRVVAVFCLFVWAANASAQDLKSTADAAVLERMVQVLGDVFPQNPACGGLITHWAADTNWFSGVDFYNAFSGPNMIGVMLFDRNGQPTGTPFDVTLQGLGSKVTVAFSTSGATGSIDTGGTTSGSAVFVSERPVFATYVLGQSDGTAALKNLSMQPFPIASSINNQTCSVTP